MELQTDQLSEQESVYNYLEALTLLAEVVPSWLLEVGCAGPPVSPPDPLVADGPSPSWLISTISNSSLVGLNILYLNNVRGVVIQAER